MVTVQATPIGTGVALHTLGDRIRALRVSRDLTPRTLAEAISHKTGHKITTAAVRKWEKDQVKNLEAINLYALADIFDTNARWIALGGSHSPIRPLWPTQSQQEALDLFMKLSDPSQKAWLLLGQQILISQAKD